MTFKTRCPKCQQLVWFRWLHRCRPLPSPAVAPPPASASQRCSQCGGGLDFALNSQLQPLCYGCAMSMDGEQKPPFVCPRCERTFFSRYGLLTHSCQADAAVLTAPTPFMDEPTFTFPDRPVVPTKDAAFDDAPVLTPGPVEDVPPDLLSAAADDDQPAFGGFGGGDSGGGGASDSWGDSGSQDATTTDATTTTE
jgi:hypothetical protein